MNPSPIDPELFSRFLAGQSTDQELEQVESILNDPSTVVDLNHQAVEDTLVWEVKQLVDQKEKLSADDPEVSRLIERINSLVPCPTIGQEELDRVLSEPESPEEIGRIGDYRVVEFIAGGGMGLVFRARDKQLDRFVCIKIMHPSMLINPEAKQRFEREARAAATLDHERIVTVYDVGVHRGLPYLVMQMLDGASLGKVMAQEGPLGEARAKKFAIQIAEGLAYAHQLGYLHRDIKPDNIWVTNTDDIKLLDFGLARVVHESIQLTNTGTVLGTPSYMSPEQVNGETLDQRSDLFSLGTVFYEMLTGTCPFTKSNLFSTMMSVARDSLPIESLATSQQIDAGLLPVVQKLLEKDPQQRFQSAQQLIDTLRDGKTLPTGTKSSVQKLPELAAKPDSDGGRGWIRKLIMGGAAAAALMLLGLFIYMQTDKGTLVVKVNDPSVKVQISDESVYVQDTKTGKTYNLKIGDNRLPSGRYELEFGHDTGELKLSSQSVTIRRGSKEIVTVSLEAPQMTAMKDPRSDAPPIDSLPNATNRDSKPFSLSDLPKMSERDLKAAGFESGKPLSAFATVGKPSPIDSVVSWTIEPSVPKRDLHGAQLSQDGRWMASFDMAGLVRIRNDQFQIKHLLPGTEHIESIVWSPVADVLAVVHPNRIVIWIISDDYAEIACLINGQFRNATWSEDGKKIIAVQGQRNHFNILNNERIAIYRFEAGDVFVEPNRGIQGWISGNPLSSDERFLATTVYERNPNQLSDPPAIITVWNMKTGQAHHEFRDATYQYSSWIPGTNQLVIYGTDRYEIWDVGKLQLIKTGSMQRDSIAEITGKGIASYDRVGKVILRSSIVDDGVMLSEVELHTKEDATKLRSSGSFKASWSANGKRLLLQAGNFSGLWSIDPVQRKSPEIVSRFVAPTRRTPYIALLGRDRYMESFQTFTAEGENRTEGRVVGLTSGKRGAWFPILDKAKNTDEKIVAYWKTFGTRFVTNGFLTSDDLEYGLTFDTAVTESGELATTIKTFSTNGRGSSRETKLVGCVRDVHWNDATSSFVVFHKNFKRTNELSSTTVSRSVIKIDMSKNEVRNLGAFWPDDQWISSTHVAGSSLIAVTKTSKTDQRNRRTQISTYHVHRYDLITDEQTSTTVGEAFSANPIVGNDKLLILPLKQRDEDSRETIFNYYQVKFGSPCQKLSLEDPGNGFDRNGRFSRGTQTTVEVEGVSHDGSHVALKESRRGRASTQCKVYQLDGDELKLVFSTEPGQHDFATWHSEENVVAISDGRRIEFVDAELKKTNVVDFGSQNNSSLNPFVATKRGWMMVTFDGIRTLGMSGETLHTLFPTERTGNKNGFAAISSKGDLRNRYDEPSDANVVYLKDRRFSTTPVSHFEKKFNLELDRRSLHDIVK